MFYIRKCQRPIHVIFPIKSFLWPGRVSVKISPTKRNDISVNVLVTSPINSQSYLDVRDPTTLTDRGFLTLIISGLIMEHRHGRENEKRPIPLPQNSF